MALSVHDELITYPGGTQLGSVAAPNWRIIPGRSAPYVVDPGINSMSRSLVSPDGRSSACWGSDTFNPDHFAELAHDPAFLGTPATVRDCGPAVRQDPNADTCYALYTNYRELPGGHVSGSGVSYGYLQQEVVRINRGAVTSLAVFYAPGWSWADDWWFGALEVWGQNPVKLRVINKAPTVFVLGSDNAGTTPQGIGQAPAECFYLIDGVQYDSEIDWRENYPDGPRALNGCDAFSSPPSSGAVAWDAPGAHLSAGRAWIVWEGQDASADRILSGQPGIRWGGDNYFAAAKFSAGEITDRLTASVISGGGSSVVIGGYRQAGNTVTVT